MNPDQTSNAIEKLIVLGSGYAIAHGIGDSSLWQTLTPAFVALVAYIYSHWRQSAPAAAKSTTPPAGGIKLLLFILLLVPAFYTAGCSTSATTTAYQASQTGAVSLDAAMTAWGHYCKEFNPSYSERLQVEGLYNKAQAAETALVEGELIAATLSTNTISGTNALSINIPLLTQQAGQALSDLVALLRNFGVSI
jgi:hypothetical protein